MGAVLLSSGHKATPAGLDPAKGALLKAAAEEDDQIRLTAARSLARLCWFLEEEALQQTVKQLLVVGTGGIEHWTLVCGRLLGMGAALQGGGVRGAQRDAAFSQLLAGCRDERQAVCGAALAAVAALLSSPSTPSNLVQAKQAQGSPLHASALPPSSALSALVEQRKPDVKSLAQAAVHLFAPTLGQLALHGASADIRSKAMAGIKQAAKFYFGAASQHLKELLPPLMASLGGIDLQVKFCAERALKHLCEGLSSAEMVQGTAPGQGAALLSFLQSGGEVAAAVKTYVRSTLPGMPIFSEDEGYD
ncbi:hypothetical protein B484DRAFT_424457 [Ochromonadaceae sp. CCMP2298]|nr:hypothetical protein B484DRAFT_424457 [Ochromonadaceae sp. CCMP2298]